LKIHLKPLTGRVSWQRTTPLTIDRDRIKAILASLRNDETVGPPAGGWTGNDMFLVAGVCSWAAMKRIERTWNEELRDEMSKLHKERLEAVTATVLDNVPATVLIVAWIVQMIESDTYDDRLKKPEVGGYAYLNDGTAVFEMVPDPEELLRTIRDSIEELQHAIALSEQMEQAGIPPSGNRERLRQQLAEFQMWERILSRGEKQDD